MGKKCFIVVLCGLFIISSFSAAAQDVPRFEAADCPAAAGLSARFECGYLIVPEDRSQPDSPTLRLMVAIYHPSSGAIKPDPVIYLNGGPGGSSVSGARSMMRVFGNLAERDIIFFDQRGTGFSEPDMTCPEVIDAFNASMEQGLTSDQRDVPLRAALGACHDRLIASGINLKSYNSAESAADVADLRTALGYEEVNLLGISYGTRLALTIMRDHPQGIRSAILDSAYPPNVDGITDGIPNTQLLFDKVFAACAADALCNAQYPELEAVFTEVVEALNANPVTVTWNGSPHVVDGYTLMMALFSWLYDAAAIPDVPNIIYQLREGNTAVLTSLVPFITIPPGLSLGMSYSVQCHEEFPFAETNRVEANLNPLMQELMVREYEAEAAACGLWDVGVADPVENEAVVSDIPALLLAGAYDPVTPPEYAELAASTLSNSFYYRVPNTGHSVLFGVVGFCSVAMSREFLNDPTQLPRATCPAEAPIVFQ